MTNKIEFEEQDEPPIVSVVSPAAVLSLFPATSQCDTPTAGDAAVDANPTGDWLRIAVDVSDQNIDDDLYAYVVVNGTNVETTEDQLIRSNGMVERGRYTVCIKAQNLRAACNVVELVVFRMQDFEQRERSRYGLDLEAKKGKYSRVRWFVLGDTNRSPGLCKLAEDGGLPEGLL